MTKPRSLLARLDLLLPAVIYSPCSSQRDLLEHKWDQIWAMMCRSDSPFVNELGVQLLWECCPHVSAPWGLSCSPPSSNCHLMTNLKGHPSFRTPCRVRNSIHWDGIAAQPLSLSLSSLASFPSLSLALILRAPANRHPACQYPSQNLLTGDPSPSDIPHLELNPTSIPRPGRLGVIWSLAPVWIHLMPLLPPLAMPLPQSSLHVHKLIASLFQGLCTVCSLCVEKLLLCRCHIRSQLSCLCLNTISWE